MSSSAAGAPSDRLVFAVPSKGRLMEQTASWLAKGGLKLVKTGPERGYQGEIEGFDGVDVAFVSAAEIAQLMKSGRAHLGVTGEDLLRESIRDCDARIEFLRPLGFGHADVVVAVPACWADVRTMADLEEAAALYRRTHGRRMRVATKYMNLTRQFFAGFRPGGRERVGGAVVTSYVIVESLGATEGTPAAGAAELIVDITSTGATLKANGLRILEDGVVLKSQANLVASQGAVWSDGARRARGELLKRLAGGNR